MERIRSKKQSVRQLGLCGAEQGRLATSIGLASKKYSTRNQLAHFSYGTLQAVAISFGFRRARWSKTAFLTKRQIAAQHGETRASKGFRESNQERRFRIAARTVSKN
jgi:hypothetical protein